MSGRWQVAVIGGGAGGVAAAAALVERGVETLMLDAGNATAQAPSDPVGTLAAQRRGESPGEVLLCDDGAGEPEKSPKYRVPANAAANARYNERYRTRAIDFTIAGALDGGATTFWGAVVGTLDDADMADWPIDPRDLFDSYRRVSRRIGVSGELGNDEILDDTLMPPPELHPTTRLLYARYRRRPDPARRQGVRLARSKHAVITRDHGNRRSCVECGLCLWGCPRQSIWAAPYDIPALKARANFTYLGDRFATALVRRGASWRILVSGPGSARGHFDAPRVLLACGAIGSAKLVLQALGWHGRPVAIKSSPAIGFALCLPRLLGTSLVDERLFGLPSLAFEVSAPGIKGERASGSLLPAAGLPATEFIRHTGCSYPLAREAVRFAQPALVVGNGYFHGDYSRHELRLLADGELELTGNVDDILPSHLAIVRKRLAGALARYGAFLVPGSLQRAATGSDARYGATVPMRHRPELNESDSMGEVRGLPGVHVVDGAALSNVSSKPVALTIMANADRIATRLPL